MNTPQAQTPPQNNQESNEQQPQQNPQGEPIPQEPTQPEVQQQAAPHAEAQQAYAQAQPQQTTPEGQPQKKWAPAPAEDEQVATLKDQLLRAVAENENLRRRTERQIEEASRFSINNFARDLLDVLENLARATGSTAPEALAENPALKSLYDGVVMTEKSLTGAFEKHGIKRILPEKGTAFDHNLHQAMVQVEDGSVPVGSIVQVMQAGYILHDRLLRPAMVTVAKAPAAPQPAPEQPTE